MAQPVLVGAVKERIQVAAIDFGTTYSGYAFSFRSHYQENPLKVFTNDWTTASHKSMSLKAPTCILFDPRKRFDSFGYEAEDKYAKLAAKNHHTDWFYFKRFKMLLYNNEELNRQTLLKDDNDNELPAMLVFTESIRFLKDHFLDTCMAREPELREDDVHWVLTVPAIWDDSAKQFMREAAISAGIQSDCLSLALEPEAASVFCQYLPIEQMPGLVSTKTACFGPDTRYMVLDAGGGTVDITVHEVQHDCTVRELYTANGGPWGGTVVDEAFYKFLRDISSEECMEEFKASYMKDYLEMLREFEIKKRTTAPKMDKRVTFKIPVSLQETYTSIHDEELKDNNEMPAHLKQQISFHGDKIRVQPGVFQEFFTDVCQKIVDHIKGIFDQPEVQNTNTILMVGGFSESRMLQHAVKKAFGMNTVIVPEEAGLAVLKGAVIFGHNPTVVTTRVSRFTYGVSACMPFIEGTHPDSRKISGDDGDYCPDVFNVQVSVGDKVEEGTKFETQTYLPLHSHQTNVTIDVCTSDKVLPSFVDEPGCRKLGRITVDLPRSGDLFEKMVTLNMTYGETELRVEATVVATGKKTNATYDFLS